MYEQKEATTSSPSIPDNLPRLLDADAPITRMNELTRHEFLILITHFTHLTRGRVQGRRSKQLAQVESIHTIHTYITIMPPRKPVSKGKQAQTQPVASSSKVTLDSLPPPDLPESLTPDFQPNQRVKIPLDLEDREALIHEVRQTLRRERVRNADCLADRLLPP